MRIPASIETTARYTRLVMRVSFQWLVMLALFGCSAAPPPVASSNADPSNPNAPEGVDPVSALNVSRASADVASVYACPMHPEVTSDHAAKCPKCGMTLVPKK